MTQLNSPRSSLPDTTKSLLPNYRLDKAKQYSPYKIPSPIKLSPRHSPSLPADISNSENTFNTRDNSNMQIKLPEISKISNEKITNLRSLSVNAFIKIPQKSSRNRNNNGILLMSKEKIKKILDTYQEYNEKTKIANKEEDFRRKNAGDIFHNKFTLTSKNAQEKINEQVRQIYQSEAENCKLLDPLSIVPKSKQQKNNKQKFTLIDRVEMELRNSRTRPDDIMSSILTTLKSKKSNKTPFVIYNTQEFEVMDVEELHGKFKKDIEKCVNEMESVKNIVFFIILLLLKAKELNFTKETKHTEISEFYKEITNGNIKKVREMIEKNNNLIQQRFSVFFYYCTQIQVKRNPFNGSL